MNDEEWSRYEKLLEYAESFENEDLQYAIKDLENWELFKFQLDNIKMGYFKESKEGDCWIYHEGDLYNQLYHIISDHNISIDDETGRKVIKKMELYKIRNFVDLLMIDLLRGDYNPEMLHPAIRHRKLYPRSLSDSPQQKHLNGKIDINTKHHQRLFHNGKTVHQFQQKASLSSAAKYR